MTDKQKKIRNAEIAEKAKMARRLAKEQSTVIKLTLICTPAIGAAIIAAIGNSVKNEEGEE